MTARPSGPTNSDVRVERFQYTADGRHEILPSLSALAELDDVLVGLGVVSEQARDATWEVARQLAAALPESLRRKVWRLRRGESDALVIDGEPEREGLPDTIDAIDRLYEGSLYSDWLGLALAWELGAGSGSLLRASHLRIEWQLGPEALHRDAMIRGAARPIGAPWSARLPTAPFTSLRCIRPGSNTELRTVIVTTEGLIEQVQEHLDVLSQPIYSCPTLDRFNPVDGGLFALIAHREGKGWDLTQAALESSLFTHQRSQGSLIQSADRRGVAAVRAFGRVRGDMARYPVGIHWKPGRRLLLNQARTFHGRDGGVTPRSRRSWSAERLLSRCTIMQQPAGGSGGQRRQESDLDFLSLLDQLRGPFRAARTDWLRRQEERDGFAALVESNATTGSELFAPRSEKRQVVVR